MEGDQNRMLMATTAFNEEILSGCRKMTKGLDTLRKKVVGGKTLDEARLKELKGKLPRIMASKALGQISQDDVDVFLMELDALKTSIRDANLILEGLLEMECENDSLLRNAEDLERRKRETESKPMCQP